MIEEPEVQYAKTPAAAYIAYEIFGTGPIDFVVFSGNLVPIDHMWDLPQLAEFMDALGHLARVITYDARGLGASDPLPTTDPAAGLESQASDLLTVLAAAESERASILTFQGSSELVIAATYPQRVRSLILTNLRSSYPELRGFTTEQCKSVALWLASPRGLSASPEQLARQMEFAAQPSSRRCCSLRSLPRRNSSPRWETVRGAGSSMTMTAQSTTLSPPIGGGW